MPDKYAASGSEAEYQPGSDKTVLRNHPGIVDAGIMDDAELALLEQLYKTIFQDAFPSRGLAVADLKDWHFQWLGNVYGWAGQERALNLGKGGFHFAAAGQIPRLLDVFQRDCLDRYTPTDKLEGQALHEALAITHVELILIHPFREGNGRLSRLLADVMAVQAGHEPLDYSRWEADKRAYFAAIQHGVAQNYEPMMQLMADALKG